MSPNTTTITLRNNVSPPTAATHQRGEDPGADLLLHDDERELGLVRVEVLEDGGQLGQLVLLHHPHLALAHAVAVDDDGAGEGVVLLGTGKRECFFFCFVFLRVSVSLLVSVCLCLRVCVCLSHVTFMNTI